MPSKSKIIVGSLSLLLIVSLGFSEHLLFQNYWWKQEATRYTQASARLEAHSMFRKGIFCLYKMDGQCDEAHFSGQHDGPFEIWIAFYQPSLGEAHRFVTERWVEAFNDQMRLMQKEPEKFRIRMGLARDSGAKTLENGK